MITTLIFDWGGVFTHGRYTPALLEELSKHTKRDLRNEADPLNELIIQICFGKMSCEEIVSEFHTKLKISLSEKELEVAFGNAIQTNHDMIEFAQKLGMKYTLILLSDSTEFILQGIKKHQPHLLQIFTKTYFSHELQICKPDQIFFKHVLNDAKLNPEECVFIDDKERNVHAAKECGMQGIVFRSVDQLKKELAKLKINIDG